MARVLVFIGALLFGTFVASLFGIPAIPTTNCTSGYGHRHDEVSRKFPINPQNLRGKWKGTWGHNSADCTIVIDRVDGNAFSGTLRKEGAEILFEGTFDPQTRMLYFDETKVVRLGDDMRVWSLGKNSGIISEDGRMMVGDGHDKWGQYGWAASNY